MKTIEELANSWVTGLPVYEPGLPIEEVAREVGIADVTSIAKLASNESGTGPSPKAMEAMHDAVASMHRYPDGGAWYLKDALSTHLGVAREQVLPVNGSNEGIELIARALLGPGSSMVMSDRAFVVYRLVATAQQAQTIAVPMVELTHDLAAMAAAIRPDTRVVFVANPNNPTGTQVSAAAIDAFMEQVPPEVVVCFDEAYVELLEENARPDTLRYVREGRHVLVLRTFSKAYGLAGLRIGYVVGSHAAIRVLNGLRQPFNVNAMAQAAACAALGDTQHLAHTRRVVQSGLSYMYHELERMGISFVPSCVNFVLIEVGQHPALAGKEGAGRRVFTELQKLGVIVRPMDGYGLPRYVRVTVGSPEENGRFVGALDIVLSRIAQEPDGA